MVTNLRHSGPGIGYLDNRYVNIDGDIMTGDLIINSDLEVNGTVEVGTTTVRGYLGVGVTPSLGAIHIQGYSIDSAGLHAERNTNDTWGAYNTFRKRRGATTASQENDWVGGIMNYLYDGANWVVSSGIWGQSTDSTSNQAKSDIVFLLSTDEDLNPDDEKWRITSSGTLQPYANNTQEIGSSGKKVRNIYVSGTSYTGNIVGTGFLDVAGTVNTGTSIVEGDFTVTGTANITGKINTNEIILSNSGQSVLWFKEGATSQGAFFYDPSTNVFGFGRYSGGVWAGYQFYWDQDDNITVLNDNTKVVGWLNVSSTAKVGTTDVYGNINLTGYITGENRLTDFTIFDPGSIYDLDSQLFIGRSIHPLTFTKIEIEGNTTTVDVAGDLKYADDFRTLGTSRVLSAFDTTSGYTVHTSDIVSGTVPSGKVIYLDFDAKPGANLKQLQVHLEWDYD
jgi:cytoskeletal protein CcmA (bactofilin family)